MRRIFGQRKQRVVVAGAQRGKKEFAQARTVALGTGMSRRAESSEDGSGKQGNNVRTRASTTVSQASDLHLGAKKEKMVTLPIDISAPKKTPPKTHQPMSSSSSAGKLRRQFTKSFVTSARVRHKSSERSLWQLPSASMTRETLPTPRST